MFLQRDPATAFDLLADVRNESQWNKGVSVAELRSDGQVGQGSKSMTVYRGMENDVTLAEFERPKHLVVAANNDRRDIDTTYTFTEANGGTRLVVSTDVRPKGITALFSPVLRMMMRRETAKKYATVKPAIEDRSDTSTG